MEEHWIVYHLKAMDYPKNKLEKRLTLILVGENPRERLRKQKEILEWFRSVIKYHKEKMSKHFIPGKTYEWFDEFRKTELSFDIQWLSLPQPSRKSSSSKINIIIQMRQKIIMWYMDEICRICVKAIASIPVTDKTEKAIKNREKENKCYELLFVTADKVDNSMAKK